MENNQKDFFSQPLQLDRFVNALRVGIYRIIFALFVAICLWAYYYSTVDRTFGVTSLLQIKESTSSQMSIEDLMAGGNERVNLNEETTIFLSNTSVKKLINKLQLNILINENDYKFDKSELIDVPVFEYNSNSIRVTSISENIIQESEFPFSLNLKKTANGYSIIDSEFSQNELFFGELYIFEKLQLKMINLAKETKLIPA